MSHSSRAFTFIELLVVIAIIGILASLLMPALRKARHEAVVAKTSRFLNVDRDVLREYETYLAKQAHADGKWLVGADINRWRDDSILRAWLIERWANTFEVIANGGSLKEQAEFREEYKKGLCKSLGHSPDCIHRVEELEEEPEEEVVKVVVEKLEPEEDVVEIPIGAKPKYEYGQELRLKNQILTRVIVRAYRYNAKSKCFEYDVHSVDSGRITTWLEFEFEE